MEHFDGRGGVITGGASGIGLATARVLAREGMNLVLADVEEAALDAAVDEVAALGVRVQGVVTDVADRAAVSELAARAFEHLGGVHLLFNNAGVAVAGAIQDMTHEDWRWSLDVNLWGVIHGVEAFVPRMIEQNEGGHVISTASFAGLVPNRGLGVYCVSKYGVVALAECLARDLKPHGIGASVLCPMRVGTRIDQSARNRPNELAATGSMSTEAREDRPLEGRVLPVDAVAEQVWRAVRAGELYVLTHEEAEPYVVRRFERIGHGFAFLRETGGSLEG